MSLLVARYYLRGVEAPKRPGLSLREAPTATTRPEPNADARRMGKLYLAAAVLGFVLTIAVWLRL